MNPLPGAEARRSEATSPPVASTPAGEPAARLVWPRAPLALLAVLALVMGVLAGLARAGWPMPVAAAGQAGNHAALMIGVFFGAVISLERAVALGRGWPYLAPAAAGAAGLALLGGAPVLVPALVLLAGASIFVCAGILVVNRQPAAFAFVLLLGAGAWFAGSVGWLVTGSVSLALPWWLAFLVLTIAGERLELTRLMPPSRRARRLFFPVVALLLVGAVEVAPHPAAGWWLFALALLALAAWLVRFDIARRNLGQRGLTRYIAVCLMSGYFWLGVSGGLGLCGGFTEGHARRDATLHALTLGFVFAMVFGHAPIILPAVARVKIAYHPVFYLPLAALHLSLAWRVAGAFAPGGPNLRGGALSNALVLLLFVAVLLTGVARGRLRAATPRPHS